MIKGVIMLLNIRWVLVATCVMIQVGCSDMSSQEQHQVINAGETSGSNYYNKQAQSIGTTLSNEIGTAFGDMH